MTLSFPGVTEVVLYSLFNFLPYIVFVVYPFRNKLRFNKAFTAVIIALATFVQIGLGIWACFFAGESKGLVSIISTAVYAGFYFLIVKADIWKMLFTLLMLSNINNFIVIASKCFEGMLFPHLAMQIYRWSFSVMTIAVQLLIMVPFFFYMKKKFTPAVEYNADNLSWSYLWLIPATFYIISHHSLYNKSLSALEVALNPGNTILLFVINLGAFLVYCVAVRMVNENAKNMELEAKNHQLAMQSLQYEYLNERIMEARRAKHDLRHHLALISGYAESGDYESLKAYLSSYNTGLPDDSTIVFCEHCAVNMLVHYFSQLSKNKDIEFSANLSIPAEISIPDIDLCVLLGNLLENAYDACSAQKAEIRRISVYGRIENSRLILNIENTFENKITKNQDGVYLSTKHSGTGIGFESAKEIAKHSGGIITREIKDGLFCVHVMLGL